MYISGGESREREREYILCSSILEKRRICII